jgi:hypothetical protein
MSERRALRFQMPCLQVTVPNAHVVVFPKCGVLISTLFAGTLDFSWRPHSFLKREYAVTNIPNSPNYDRKLGFYGGCRQIHAYWLHIYKFCEKESSVKLKCGYGCSPLCLHQGIEEKKKKTVVKQCSFFFWPGFLLFWYSGYQYEGKKRVVFM